MNKSELIAAVATTLDIDKKTVEKVLDTVLHTITDNLTKGEETRLPGFAVIEVSERKARTGRNPQTGEALQIAASKNVVLRALKELKEILNPKKKA